MESPGDKPTPHAGSADRTFREVLGEWMVDAVDWADQHRRSLVCGSILGVCSKLSCASALHDEYCAYEVCGPDGISYSVMQQAIGTS